MNEHLYQAYSDAQEQCGLEVGDKVRVLRRASTEELGWGVGWAEPMDRSIGEVFEIHTMHQFDGRANTGVRLSNSFNYPFFVLELVEKREVIDNDEELQVLVDEVWDDARGDVPAAPVPEPGVVNVGLAELRQEVAEEVARDMDGWQRRHQQAMRAWVDLAPPRDRGDR